MTRDVGSRNEDVGDGGDDDDDLGGQDVPPKRSGALVLRPPLPGVGTVETIAKIEEAQGAQTAIAEATLRCALCLRFVGFILKPNHYHSLS